MHACVFSVIVVAFKKKEKRKRRCTDREYAVSTILYRSANWPDVARDVAGVDAVGEETSVLEH